MSLWREVLSGILAKNRTLKCLKWHYLTVQSLKNVAVVTEDGTFALFLRPPPPGGFDSTRVPIPPGICHPRRKNANAQGSARSWN